jgi:peptidoglycan/LPS O-acetylase OafA/YrhL
MGLFRFLLALSVIATHGSAVLGSTLYPGGGAVQVFFMISGFYMALVLGGRYELTRQGLMLFYTNRALRLYPAFLAVTLGIWALFFVTWVAIGRMPTNTWAEPYAAMSWPGKLALISTNWLMLGSDVLSSLHFSPEQGICWMFPEYPPQKVMNGMLWLHELRTNGPAWSIGTEIWFYLLVPFLVRLRWWWTALLFAASMGLRLWISEGLGRYPYFFFPAQLLFFIAGVWGCQLYRHFRLAEKALPWARWVLLLNWAMVWLYPWYGAYVPEAVLYVVVAASLPVMFRCSKDWHWDRSLGDLSYPLYLVHLPLHSLIYSRLGINSGTVDALGAIACALFIVWVIERPFERMRRARVQKHGIASA